jgi:homoprotocatechuate degradation regulator HpaR
MQLMRAREQVMQRFRAHLRAHGLTDQQWRVIRALVEVDSLEIVDLSARCVIHPASLSRILPKLQARRLITRRTNEIDQRRTIVSIASAGRELFATLVPESQAIYKQIERELGVRRLKEIYTMLGELIAILSTNAALAEFED